MTSAIAALVAQAHSLDGDPEEWLDALVRAASTAIGRGVVGNLVERRSDGGLVSVHVALHGVAPEWRETLRRTATRMRSEELERRFQTAVAVTKERGVLAVSARGDERTAVLLDATLDPPLEEDGARLIDVWTAVADHLATALRSRSKIRRAKNAAPSSADDAETVWRALLDGKLSITDRFDRDGRRFVVVRATDPRDGGALTVREREVLASVALGHSNKRIALDLGVSESTVSAALRGAARKLGVRSRVELARILGPRRITSRS